VGDILLVPPPPDEKVVELGLKKCLFANMPAMRSFVNDFGSLYENIPPHAGDFRVPNEWKTLFDYWGEDNGRYGKWYPEWSGSLVIYGSSVGDMVLLHPKGKLVWLGFAENELWELSDNFDEFVHRYAKYRRKSRFGLEGDILAR